MTAPAISAPAPKGRLGNGQLRRQVAEWLAARPGPHTVGEIAKDLGRSAGAVGNALTTLADRAEAARITGKPLRYEANSATAAAVAAITPKAPARPRAPLPRRRPRRRKPAAPRSRPEGRARPGHPPRRAGLPAACTGRHGRRRGAAHAAHRRRPRPACRAARHGQDQPGRGGLPRPDHRGRGRRHHGGRLRRRVHPEARRHLRVHLRAADQGHAGRPGAVHRRRDPRLAGGAGGLLPRDGRPPRGDRQGPQDTPGFNLSNRASSACLR